MIRPTLLLLGLTALQLSARSTSGPCEALLLDNASVLSPADRERLETASQPLKQQEAEVHLFTVSDGKPAAAVRETLAACSACQTWSGEANDNLILLAIAPKSQESSLLYGPGWRAALDDHWAAIRQTDLVPPVRNGRWADAFVETERALSGQIRAYQTIEEQKAVSENAGSAGQAFSWARSFRFSSQDKGPKRTGFGRQRRGPRLIFRMLFVPGSRMNY